MAFEQEQTGTTITNRHYVSAMGQAFLMLTSAGTHTAVAAKTITDRQWWHRDHLGSIASITNASYVVTQRFSYDPFGKRRDITGSYDANGVLVYDHPTATDRGFTGHEHLDDVGIIHMNGRLYDPRIGRFLQADPYIQRHDNTQSYNRYSYVLNNPLNATDPSGQIAIEVFYWAAAAIFSARAVGIIDTRTARQLLGLLVTAYIAGMDPSMLGVNSCSAAVDTTFIQAVAGGIAGGAVSCGADCAGMAGASAITFFAIGQWANGVYGGDEAGRQATGRAIAHGVGGCVISTFEGGKCGQGAATAFLGKAITSRLNTTGYLELDIARAGVVGGTLSSIGGGKFANGAMMGAFQYLFNALRGQRFVRYRESLNNTILEMQGRTYESIIRAVNPGRSTFETISEPNSPRYTEQYVRYLETESIREVNNASARVKEQAWRNEVQAVREGSGGTRAWSFSESRELLSNGKVSGYQVHHIEAIAINPSLAGSISNVRILSQPEHVQVHRQQ
jgi:RHS repeat-associated protein